MYKGDYPPSAVVTHRFTTEDTTGALVTLAGTPAARVRKGTGVGTTSTLGVTLTVDVMTGQHCVDVDLSASVAFYAAGSECAVELTAGTVDGVSKAGAILCWFSILNRSAVLSASERNAMADALLDRADAIETGLTPRQAHRLEVAAAAGKLSGAATTTVVIRNAVADSKARLTATVTADGDRTAITTDVT